jgi:predicted GIY-YIG superfamily endonuclease
MKKRCIYTITKNDLIYVGLTSNPKRRESKHRLGRHKSTKVLCGDFTFSIIVNFIEEDIAANIEIALIDYYRGNSNYRVLNVDSGGGLGNSSGTIWNKAVCIDISSKYKTIKSFRRDYPSAYVSVINNNWIDEAFKHMTRLQKPNGYWTKERCANEAKKYSSRSEFQNSCSAACDASKRLNIWDEVCSHMKYINKPNGYWTKERCANEAKKYSSRSEFQKMSGSSYNASKKNGWLNEICSHMKSNRWSIEKVIKLSKGCKSREDFRRLNAGAYQWAWKNKKLNELFK